MLQIHKKEITYDKVFKEKQFDLLIGYIINVFKRLTEQISYHEKDYFEFYKELSTTKFSTVGKELDELQKYVKSIIFVSEKYSNYDVYRKMFYRCRMLQLVVRLGNIYQQELLLLKKEKEECESYFNPG